MQTPVSLLLLTAPISSGDLQRQIVSNPKKERGRVAGCREAVMVIRRDDQAAGVWCLREREANREKRERIGSKWKGHLQGPSEGMDTDKSCICHHYRKRHCVFQNVKQHKPG